MASRIGEEAECDVGRLRGRLEGMQLEINTNQRKTEHAVGRIYVSNYVFLKRRPASSTYIKQSPISMSSIKR